MDMITKEKLLADYVPRNDLKKVVNDRQKLKAKVIFLKQKLEEVAGPPDEARIYTEAELEERVIFSVTNAIKRTNFKMHKYRHEAKRLRAENELLQERINVLKIPSNIPIQNPKKTLMSRILQNVHI